MVPHFGALVVRHRAPHLTFEAVEDLGEGLRGDVGFRTAQLHQGHKQSGAFDQRTDLPRYIHTRVMPASAQSRTTVSVAVGEVIRSAASTGGWISCTCAKQGPP